jgi:hypothetical protein
MLVLAEEAMRRGKIKLMMGQARPAWQSYEQAIMTYPNKFHDDDQGDNNSDDNNDLYAMVFSMVFLYSLCSPSPSHMKVD